MQLPVCIDDFGTSVYECRYTRALVWADSATVIGATMPGVKARYVMATTDQANAAHKASVIAFHESEENCNTCRFLERVQRDKSKAGFLFGRCKSATPQIEASPYFNLKEGDVMVFHPEDPMHMPCYVSRWDASNVEVSRCRRQSDGTKC